MNSTSRRAFVLLSALSIFAATACSARPGDAPTVDEPISEDKASAESKQQSEAEKIAEQEKRDEARRVIRVGVESFTGNLNPHLQGNLDPVVSAISDLTLPSVFTSGVVNSSLMKSVEPNDPNHPTKVTYEVDSAAQWSDGTPITVSDFQYLAETIAKDSHAAESALYQGIKSIDTSVSSTTFTVEFNQPFGAWKNLFHHLLPSHIYRGENRPFAEMMRESSAASGGAYSVKSIDAGRGTAELQRNDRYWGESPAMTDRILFTAVPDVNTGAQMLRTEQINMLVQPAEPTTELTLDQLSDVQQRSVVRPAQLNMVLNSRREELQDERVRTAILSAIDAPTVGQVAAEDMEAEKPEWQLSSGEVNADAKRAAEAYSEEDPLVIAAPIEDPRAVVASRTVADQLVQAGIPAHAVQMEPKDLFSGASKGAPDATILWQYSPRELSDYVSQFQCQVRAEQVKSVSGLCDSDIDSLLGQLQRGEANLADSKSTLDDALAQRAVVLPLLGSRYSVATAEELHGPTADLEDWPVTPSAGIFATAARWTIENDRTKEAR